MADEETKREADVDELLRQAKPRYSDKMRINPFKQDYYKRHGVWPGGRRGPRQSTRT